MLCKYKDLFGKPGKGVHRYRLFGLAIVDVAMTIGGAYVISLFSEYDYFCVLLGLFLLGIGLHRLFCVDTVIDKILFQ